MSLNYIPGTIFEVLDKPRISSRASISQTDAGVMAVYDLIPLNLLPPGQTASIDQITGVPEQVHRLQELGLRGGTTVEMLQSGSPCIVRLAGQKLCFRADELLRVLVRRGATT